MSMYDHPNLVQSKYVVADNYRTHYLEAGSAKNKPLVLVHGGHFETGMGVDRWYPTILPLAKRFHVFAPDELGGGGTDAPRNLNDIGQLRVRADHILSFIEALPLGPVHLVGQSQGSWIVAYIALKRPDLVDRLVLVDSASLALEAGGMGSNNLDPKFANSYLPGTMVKPHLVATKESIRDGVAPMVYDQSMLSDPFLERLVPLAEKWLPIWREPWREFWADGGKRNREQYEIDGQHISAFVQNLPSPPLIIWGKNSAKGLDTGIELYKRIPDAQFHIFDKANHFLWLDQWRDFNSLVSWFLSKPE
ncbi:alpha/beta fold hydrolase [Rhizobium leguminosarum]|uniref:alpha/beta fold hydrolase n=1 Tax=Rhizobium leguminosarum TaxID=384 RepID=UPI003F9B4450